MIKLLQAETTAATTAATNVVTKPSLHIADYVVIALYLAVIFGIGLFFWWWQRVKKQNDMSAYFTGKGKNPIWVVGLSIWATILSSLFYLTGPVNSIETRWMWAGANIALVGITPFITIWVIPFYRRLKESTAYSYLQNRFSYSIRAFASMSFILFQIFRIAVVLYVPTLALSLIIDTNAYIILAAIGIIVLFVTLFGGFKAVIWSDAIQAIVLIVGIVLIIIFSLAKTNWGSKDIVYHQILAIDSWKVSLASGGIAIISTYNVINSMYAFMASQDVTQRYKGTRNINEIRKTLYITAGLGILTILLFFGAGSAIYTFYSSQGHPIAEKDGIKTIISAGTNIPVANVKTNGFVGFFVATQLPVGVVGLILAAVFAASQSTVSSGLSALGNSIVIDFIKPFKKDFNDKTLLIISKIVIFIGGVFAIAFGMGLLYGQQDSIPNYFTGIVALTNAPTIGIFILGLFTKRTNARGALVAVWTMFLISLPIWILSQGFIPAEIKITFSGIWLTIVNFFGAILIGYFGSIIFEHYKPSVKTSEDKLRNKTVWTRTKEFKQLMKIEQNLAKALSMKKKNEKGSSGFSKIFPFMKNKKPKNLDIDQSVIDKLQAKYDELDQIVNKQTF